MKGNAQSGSLDVVGTGIRVGQLSVESLQAIQMADVVFSVVTDEVAFAMLECENSNVVDLRPFYARGKERMNTYQEMAEHVLASVREGRQVCFAMYGHPTIFAQPTRLALEAARAEGFEAQILPGISSQDSLFCDLEIDPAVHGCQTYSATSFLKEERIWDPRAVLTLWQVSIIGESRLMEHGDEDWHRRLCDRLEKVYGPEHPVIFYEASTTPFFGPDQWKAPLCKLRNIQVRPCCTLVIPPIDHPDLVKAPLADAPVHRIAWPTSAPAS